MRFPHTNGGAIDYRLNLLGIRISRGECQLIAKGGGDWEAIGPKRPLPINIPANSQELHTAASDALRMTAWQYDQQFPDSRLRAVLLQEITFEAAIAAEA